MILNFEEFNSISISC